MPSVARGHLQPGPGNRASFSFRKTAASLESHYTTIPDRLDAMTGTGGTVLDQMAQRRACGDDDTLVGMAAELVRSDRLFSGVPYAYAATAPETGLIVTAGACPLDEQGRVVAPGDVAAQTRQAIDNLRIALEECGAGLRDVLKTTVYVSSSSRDDLVAAWNEVAAGFGEHDPPSTLLGVTVLGYPDQLVEIEAIAAATPR